MQYQNIKVQEMCSTFEKEYQAVSERVGLVALPWKKVIALTGADAQSFLDRMLSNKIIDLKLGEGCHATLLQKTGYMIADLYVLCFKDHFWLIVDEIVREKTIETLNKFIVADEVSLEDISQDLKVVSIFGKESEGFIKKKWNVSLEHPFSHREVDGTIIYKSTHTLFPSFDFIIPQKGFVDLRDVETIGFGVLNTLRIEAGRAWYPFEISEKTIPLEINFQDAISYDKGCYTGQETIAKATYRGHVNKVLVKLLVEGAALPQKDSEIFLNEKKVGWITSSCHSQKYNQNIALGFIKYDLKDSQNELSISGKTGPFLLTAHLIE